MVLDKPESAAMSRPRKGALPAYRLQKARGCAVVTIDGHDHYLGPFGSPSSKQKYAALIRAWQQRQEQPAAKPDAPLMPNDRPAVNELILAYLKHARDYYRLNHGENKEAGCINDALAVLQEQGYGREPAAACRPGARTPGHLDHKGKVWVYHVPPEANKTEHHDQERKVYVGPRAQKILKRWLENVEPDQHVFSPARAEALRQAARRDSRKTPLWPS